MYEKMIDFLRSYKYTKLSLAQLEAQAPADASYGQFAQVILQLIDHDVLSSIKSHGDNRKHPALPLTYRIHKSILQQPVKQRVYHAQFQVHPSISLEQYLKQSIDVWEYDWPYIQKVHEFIRDHEQRLERATVPERSFQIVGDEKWIDEKGGRKLLERIGVWDLLKMNAHPDPLMFSCDPQGISRSSHIHFIVENKATYLALEPILRESTCTTLIYGAGWKIVSNIDRLPKQIHLLDEIHHYYYFGDLDYEGIAIWSMLYERVRAIPATAFYLALLQKAVATGKETQRPNREGVKQFGRWFSSLEQERMESMLENGCYLPQEALSINELQAIWRDAAWTID